MGITISHKLGAHKVFIPRILDKAQKCAEYMARDAKIRAIDFSIRRQDPYTLLIDIGHCETLGFFFKSVDAMCEDKNYYVKKGTEFKGDGRIVLEEGYNIKEFPQNELWYCSDFCKTQFSKNIIEHKYVADIIKVVAQACRFADVNDEADYYYSGDLEDAQKAINQNGPLIDTIGGTLAGMGYTVVTN